jgi:hypothetical protein
VYIPYYNPNSSRIERFKPDFIFWFRKGYKYLILFLDPKGTEHTANYRKIDGYKEFFEKSNGLKTFTYEGWRKIGDKSNTKVLEQKIG